MAFDAGEIVIGLTARDGGFVASIKRAGTSLQSLEVSAERTAKSVRRLEQSYMSIGTQFRHTIMLLGHLRFAMMDINDVFIRLPSAILKTAGALEQTQQLLSGLSTKLTKTARDAEGAANFQYITELAMKAPFAIGNLSDSFVKLKAGGIDPMNGALNTMVDSVARFGGSSESLQRATIAIQQMSGKGVVSMEELRQQLGEAVPTAMRDMAIGTGLSMAALAKAVSLGTVEASDAINRMFVVMRIQNQGAAADLMNTWNGMLSQLNTRLALASKDIYDSGFGKAVKDVIGQVGTGLDSNDFKRFTDTVGRELGAATTAVTNAIKTIYEFGEAIKTAVALFVSYKIGAVITGEFNSIKSQVGLLTAEYVRMGKISAQKAASVVADAIAEASASKTASLAKAAAAQVDIATIEMMIAANRAETASLLEKNNAMRAALATSFSTGRGVSNPNGGRMISREAAVAQIASIDAVGAASRRANMGMQEDLALTRSAHAAAGIAAAEQATKIVAIETGSMAAGRGMTILKNATQAAGLAFAALGGVTMAFNLLLMAGVYIWSTWETAADKAVAAQERFERAQKGLSNKDDKEKSNAAVEGAIKQLERTQQLYGFAVKAGWNLETAREFDKKEFEKYRAMHEKAVENLADLKTKAILIDKAISDRAVAEYASIAMRETDAKMVAITNETNKEKIALAEATKEKMDAAKSNQALITKISLENGNAMIALATKDSTKRLKELRDRVAEVTAAEGTVGVARTRAVLAELNKQIVTELANLNNARLATPKWSPVAAPAKPGGSMTPMQTLIANLKAERLELEAEAEATKGTLNRALSMPSVAIEAKAKNGIYNYAAKKGDPKLPPSDAQLREAMTQADAGALLKDTAKRQESFIALMDNLGPRYRDALNVLANPLEESKMGSQQRKLAKYLEELKSMPGALERLALQLKVSAAQLETDLNGAIGQAVVIDRTADFAKIAMQTKDLQNKQVDFTREGSLKRKESLDEDFRLIEQGKVNALKSKKDEMVQMLAMQGILDANMAARAADNAREFRTPMEKLSASWAETTNQMEQNTAKWASSGLDVMTNFVKTGKLEWASLADSIITDLIRIQLQKSMGNAISGVMGDLGTMAMGYMSTFAGGGVMTDNGAVPLRAYAAGGIANSPQMAMFGEGSMNEAYVPLPDGRTIPVTMSGNSSQVSPNVTVNVINQSGTQVTAKQGQPRFDGKQMILDVVLSGMNTPGPFRDNMRNAQG
jgi:tape measure domain-containing protein